MQHHSTHLHFLPSAGLCGSKAITLAHSMHSDVPPVGVAVVAGHWVLCEAVRAAMAASQFGKYADAKGRRS